MTPPRKARKTLNENSEKPQVKSYHLKDVFGSDDRQNPAFVRRNKNEVWRVAIDYQFILRFLGDLARRAASGVTAADKALDEIAEKMPRIREGHRQPGDTSFATHREWKEFLDNKLAEWAEVSELSAGWLLVHALKCCVHATAAGEPEAEMALAGTLRKLEKLAKEVARVEAEDTQNGNTLKVASPSPEELQKLYDLPSELPQ